MEGGWGIIGAWLVAGVLGGIVASQTARQRGRGLMLDLAAGLGASLLGGIVMQQAGIAGAWAVTVAVIAGALAIAALHAARRQ